MFLRDCYLPLLTQLFGNSQLNTGPDQGETVQLNVVAQGSPSHASCMTVAAAQSSTASDSVVLL